MKLLEKQFVKNCDGVGDTTFTQLKKKEVNGKNIYIYSREKPNWIRYEVFIAKQRFKGQPLPGGAVEAEDREQYPTANSFGFTAKEVTTLERAEIVFNEFISKKDDSAPEVTQSTLNYSAGKFTMKDLLLNNPTWSQPRAYIQIQKDIKAGLIKEVDRVKNANGRGKPSVVYSNT